MKITRIDANTKASIVSEKATGISAHFARIRDGNMPTAPTPLFKRDRQAAWKRVEEILSRYEDKYPRLVEYEKSRMSKIGPQGGYPALEERLPDLELYYSSHGPVQLKHDDPELYNRLIEKVRLKLFGKQHSKRALEPEAVLKRDIFENKVDTNSGLPDFSKRNAAEVQQRAVYDAKSGKWKQYPYVLGSRSSRGKARFIFMAPMSTNLVGKGFVIPMMDIIRSRKVPSFSAWEGFDDVENQFTVEGFARSKTFVSMDYTKMDTTVGPDQVRLAYDVCAPIFQPKYRDKLLESMMHPCTASVMISEDKIIEPGEHGYFSGTEWTNFVECVISEFVHALILEILNNLVKYGFEPLSDIQIAYLVDQLLGDDGAFSFDAEIPEDLVAKVIALASKLIGLIANAEKQRVTRNTIVYLQRFFDINIKSWKNPALIAGSYPIVYALNTAMYPERFHSPEKWNSRMEILRWIMILENCSSSPMFEDIVKLFIDGDRDRLGLNLPGFFKRLLPKDYEEAKSIRGFVPTYTTNFEKRGINDFEVVKLLQRMQ